MKRQDGYLTKESGAWLGHYSKWILDHKTGRRKRLQRAFKIGLASAMTKTQAKEKLRERVVEEVGLTADSRVTVTWFIEQCWKPLHEGGWRESTKRTNEELLKVIIARFGSTAVEDVSSVHLHGWLNSLAKSRSASAVKHLRLFLRSIFADALEQDYIRKNPARTLRLPKLKTVAKPYLTLDQIRALLKETKWLPREQALLTFILSTALRPSELFALRWRSVDLAKGTMTITETVYRGVLRPYTKTTEEGEVQRLLVPVLALEALAKWHYQTEHKDDEDYIFPNSEGGFLLTPNYQNRVLKLLAKVTKIPRLNFQVLRRTVATHAQDLGSPKDIATIMRHKQVQTSKSTTSKPSQRQSSRPGTSWQKSCSVEFQRGPIGNVEVELEGFEQRTPAIRREIGVAQRYVKGGPILYRPTLCLGVTFGYTVAGCDGGNVIVLHAHNVNGLHGVKTSIVVQARNQSVFLRRADGVFEG
jgi:integrase